MAANDATKPGATAEAAGANGAAGGADAEAAASAASAAAHEAEAEADAAAEAAAVGGDELAKVRGEAAKYRRERNEWKKRAEDAAAAAEAATATAEERLERLEAAERRNARATVERLALAAGFHAGEPAHEADALAQLLAGDDGEAAVADRLAAVAKERPYLVAAKDGAGRVLTPGRQGDVADAAAPADAWLRG